MKRLALTLKNSLTHRTPIHKSHRFTALIFSLLLVALVVACESDGMERDSLATAQLKTTSMICKDWDAGDVSCTVMHRPEGGGFIPDYLPPKQEEQSGGGENKNSSGGGGSSVGSYCPNLTPPYEPASFACYQQCDRKEQDSRDDLLFCEEVELDKAIGKCNGDLSPFPNYGINNLGAPVRAIQDLTVCCDSKEELSELTLFNPSPKALSTCIVNKGFQNKGQMVCGIGFVSDPDNCIASLTGRQPSQTYGKAWQVDGNAGGSMGGKANIGIGVAEIGVEGNGKATIGGWFNHSSSETLPGSDGSFDRCIKDNPTVLDRCYKICANQYGDDSQPPRY